MHRRYTVTYSSRDGWTVAQDNAETLAAIREEEHARVGNGHPRHPAPWVRRNLADAQYAQPRGSQYDGR